MRSLTRTRPATPLNGDEATSLRACSAAGRGVSVVDDRLSAQER